MTRIHLTLYPQHLPEFAPPVSDVTPEFSLYISQSTDKGLEAPVEKGDISGKFSRMPIRAD